MWREERKDFKGIVWRAVNIYNNTPLERTLGAPQVLWRAGREIWDRLIERARSQREIANRRSKGRRQGQTLILGQRVWLWDTSKEGNIGDKLAPLWRGPGMLVQRLTKSTWVVEWEGRRLTLHSDMLRPFWATD